MKKQILRAAVILGLLASIYSIIPPPRGHAQGVVNPVVSCPCSQYYNTAYATLGLKPGTGLDNVTKTVSQQETLKVVPDKEGRFTLQFKVPGYNTVGNCGQPQPALQATIIDSNNKTATYAMNVTSTSNALNWPGQTPPDLTNQTVYTFSLTATGQSTEQQFNAHEWFFPLTMKVSIPSSTDACVTFKLSWCNCGCDKLTCKATGNPTGGLVPNTDALNFSLPIGTSNSGRGEAYLEAEPASLPNPGPSALKLIGSPQVNATTDPTGSMLTGLATDSMVTTITGATSTDPNAYKVTVSTPGGSVIRTTTVESPSNNTLQMTTVYQGTTRVMLWTRNVTNGNAVWTFTDGMAAPGAGNGLTQVQKTLIPLNANASQERIITSEWNSSANAYAAISDHLLTYTLYSWGWELTQDASDPTGANLVSAWSYYAPDLVGTGTGLLQGLSRPDGYYENHTYNAVGNTTIHTVVSPFTDGSSVLTRSSSWNSDNSTLTETEQVNGNTLSMVQTFIGGNVRTATVFPSASSSMTTTTLYVDPALNSGNGGQPAQVSHPDGTLTTYVYGSANGNLSTTTTTGAGSGGTVVDGSQTITQTSPFGQVISSTTTAVGTGAGTVLDQWTATALDFLGRPQTVQYFASSGGWTTTTTYDCCGVGSETDRYGITTTYMHDLLGRQTQATRLGVTTTTVYNGLTTSTLRNGQEIARSVRDLSATHLHDWGPSPQTGTLQQLSSTAISYGGGQSSVTTAIAVADDNGVPATQTENRYLDGKVYRSTGNLQPSMQYSYSVNGFGLATTRSYLANGALRESATTQLDWAGRTLQQSQGNAFTSYAYNTLGQLVSTTDADAVKTLYGYNAKGERTTTALRLNSGNTSDVIDYGNDQVTATATTPATYNGSGVLSTVTQVYLSGSSPTTVSTVNRLPSGLRAWTILPGVANPTISWTALGSGGNWTEATSRPDGTSRVSLYSNGRLGMVQENTTSSSAISWRSYSYDLATGRLSSTTDSILGYTSTAYVSAISDAVLSTSGSAGTTAYTYDHRGRRKTVKYPDNSIASTSYYADGSISANSGSQTYSTSYTYDYAARMQSMTTNGTVAATTRWNYDPVYGRLTSKQDASNTGPAYAYTPAGRLRTRTWARGTNANSNHPHARYDYVSGRLVAVRYFTSDGADNGSNTGNDFFTGDIGILYDRLGNRTRIVTSSLGQPATSISYAYNPNSPYLVSSESFSVDPDLTFSVSSISGVLVNEGPIAPSFQRFLTRPTDNLLRSTGVVLGGELSTTLGYFPADGRLQSVTANWPTAGFAGATGSFSYLYQPNSYSHIQSMTGPVHVATNSWSYSYPDTIVSKANTSRFGGQTRSSYTYGFNALGQRSNVSTSGSAFTTPANWNWQYDSAGEVQSAQQVNTSASSRFFAFDGIGNRQRQRAGTFFDSGGTLTSYLPNALNEYSSIGTLIPQYDADGNLTAGPLPINPGVNTTPLIWDGENRLTEVSAPVRYLYDGLGRRVMKTIYGNGGSVTRTYFVYDGWNLLAEYTGAVPGTGTPPPVTLQRSYAWGTDLSGTAQGAGGVGGLLAACLFTGTTGVYYPLYDGNGNVTEYLNSTGNVAAHYEYGPFGEPLVATVAVAAEMPFRFSTKYQDAETGLYSYLFRPYDPITGRWLKRDPIEEEGGFNLYAYVLNKPTETFDPMGLDVYFAIYYNNTNSVTAGSFFRAAETWKREVLNRDDYTTCDIIIVVGASTESDFLSAWHSVQTTAEAMSMKVKEGIIFSHATPGNLEWKGSTFTLAESKMLPVLPWTSNAKLSLQGCNTGSGGLNGIGSCAAGFNATQGILVESQPGYSYFSESPNSYVKIDSGGTGPSTNVYLRAYKRGKNSWFGSGRAIPPIVFPSGRFKYQ